MRLSVEAFREAAHRQIAGDPCLVCARPGCRCFELGDDMSDGDIFGELFRQRGDRELREGISQ